MILQTSKAVLLSFALASCLPAALINYNPAPTTDTGWTNCANYPGYSCRTTANFDTQSLSDQNDDANVNSLFVSAFNAWNASGGGQGWTLAYGGDLSGTFDVTIAKAEQFDASNAVITNNVVKGGEEIRISVANITLPTLGTGDQLVWAQGLFDNYLSNGTIVTPFYEMDIDSVGCSPAGPSPWCPPAYPFQYPDNRFYDQPASRYQPPGSTQGFFDANAYLSVENNTTKTLTVYDGVSYGFQNFVSPEPGVWLLCLSGFILMALVQRKRRASN